MTEDEARRWISARHDVSRETRLAQFVHLLRDEATRQNLVSPSTLDAIWARHIVDSAQLLKHGDAGGLWLDIGSGAGLPGIVLAILRDGPVELVEPRKLRTAFLQHCADTLGLTNVTIHTAKVERTKGRAAVVTARAVGTLDTVFRIARHRTDRSTIWVLPKGRNAQSEVEDAKLWWQGSFHVEPSVTAPDSLIVVAKEVRPR
ncbi:MULTISPECIES: 16S rRNA (guanine(527)-N(7))-methyltransferase RsmG [unclassified Sphingomonas]|uniref:16S rRNA (guanine(527)-N(7))-methyltransferase RsmG n=1 Tax=unclassified Sphingomonas TaxID=196159 RepID=UPI002151E040|nr:MULTISPECIES: 16S rRNA (guanine(527)-N(7))-methyltransferase RsmG [unclassified Sphingomonas]MCR5870417.1 16S rRNA (guanine(527)-N(7))-methyltransferase RsmG [Sphingomonas sp. J344]UUY01237.1 16S rRNA (guanine(527)-N(7))-methyltransferase RsmG [Sphingomonas sp. J315]